VVTGPQSVVEYLASVICPPSAQTMTKQCRGGETGSETGGERPSRLKIWSVESAVSSDMQLTDKVA